MSRSGYSDDCDEAGRLNLYRGTVDRALSGKRGQAFLRELAAALDVMPEKKLIEGELINAQGECCAIGVVCKARGIDVSKVECEDPKSVAQAIGVAKAMAAEIAYMNDEYYWHEGKEDPAARWTRMREWVDSKLKT